MRIVVNTSFLLQEQWTGVCRHMYYQLVALAESDVTNQFTFVFLVPPGLNYLYEALTFPINVKKLKLPIFQRFREPLDLLWQRKSWPPLDLFVGKHDAYLSPAWSYLPSNANVCGVFVYDMTCFDSETTSINKSIESSRLETAKKRNAHLWIVNSHYTRARLKKVLAIQDSNIILAYPGLVSSFTSKHTISSSHRNYFMYFGSDDKRKNLANVLGAFDLVVKKYPSYRFRIVSKDNKSLKSLYSYPWLDIEPYVDDKKLMQYLDESKAVVYASLEEGFGMPVLEALAYGVPVITSKDSSMVEITGIDWPWLVDPASLNSIATAMEQLISSSDNDMQIQLARLKPSLTNFDFSLSAQTILSGLKKRL